MSQEAKFNMAYLFPFVILCYTFSLLWGWFPYIRSLITITVGLVAGLLVSYRYFSQKPAVYYFLYLIVIILNVISGDSYYNSIVNVFYFAYEILLPVLFVYGILNSNNEKLLNTTVIIVLWMLIINAIGSFMVDTIYPGSIRAIHGTIRETGSNSTAIIYYKYGVATYSLPHALPSIIPILIMGIKTISNKSRRWLMIISLVACLLLVYLSGATTPVITAFIAVILAVFTGKKTGIRQIILFGILTIVLLVVASNDKIMLSMLGWLDDLMGNEGYFHRKILDFENLIVYGDTTGDIGEREDLYTETWQAIIAHPILGVNYQLGGHSNLLDTWGRLGLVGLIPFVLFIVKQVGYSAKWLKSSSRFYYYEGFFMAAIMLALKFMAGWESWLFLFTILPLLTLYVEKNQDKV